MAIPEGYVALDFVGFTDRGTYNSGATYVINDLVHDAYNNIWKCLQDNTSNVAPAAGAYWTLFMGSSDSLAGTTATDTSGVLGSAGQIVVAQSLVDAIAGKVMNSLVDKNQIVNNLLATVAGNVLDAMQGKLLQDQISTLNGKFAFEYAVKARFSTTVSTNTAYIDLYDSENTFYRIQFNGNSSTITFSRYSNGMTTLFTK